MSAYYNENDPFAAAWLRELIKGGHIAQGDVDERSIREVKGDEISKYTQCHFFAGIGVWSYSLRKVGWTDDRPVWTGSCPCQPFSAAGKRKGIEDDRHLWPVFQALIKECRPRTVFGEQVASKDGLAWLDIVQADLEGAGYTTGAVDMCAAGFGAPHIRQRLYFVADSPDARREQAREYECGSSPLSSRPAECCRVSVLADRQAVGRGEECPDARRINEENRTEGRTAGLMSGCPDGGVEYAPGEQVGISGLAREPRTAGVTQGDSAGGGLQMRAGEEISGREAWGSRERSGDAGVALGDTSGTGFSERECDGQIQPGKMVASTGKAIKCPSNISGLGITDGPGSFPGDSSAQTARQGNTTDPTSFWSECEWIRCIDGKTRPVKSGIFPLAHGATNRVGRLRGYGNALCSEVAQGFILAYMEVRGLK